MLIIKAPMLAYPIQEDEIASLQLPLLVSDKEDGIRGVTSGSGILSRRFKPLPNFFLQKVFRDFPPGLEGEIVVMDDTTTQADFTRTESCVMSQEGKFPFWFYAFDYVHRSKYVPYVKRLDELQQEFGNNEFINPIQHSTARTHEQIEEMLRDALTEGKEGVCLHKPDGFYKYGRSTFNEHLFLKLKPWLDGEAKVIGFEPRYANNNMQVRDKLGYAKRSTHQANLQACNEVGSILAHSKEFGELKISSGFTRTLGVTMWENQESFIGRAFTFRYRKLTIYGVPMHARFNRFRLYLV